MSSKKVIIIGGGVAGLVASVLISRAGIACEVFEKRKYPMHRVCGEYISNEALPFLKSVGLFPEKHEPSYINRLLLTAVTGKPSYIPLEQGGFGISRYIFDNFLFNEAEKHGVTVYQNTAVESVEFLGHSFSVNANGKSHLCDVVIGAFGKRSNLDIRMKRSFTQVRSPYVGVKYHINFDHPEKVVALHNFPGGYCGVSHVEGGKVNLCYLVHREQLRIAGSIPEMEKKFLSRNPQLREIFRSADFLFEQPETINEISFREKSPVENHVLMIGDSAGMITPLCGNGMAMAIHSAKILSELVNRFSYGEISRQQLESEYRKEWREQFANRLWAGRQIQKLFGSAWTSSFAVNLATYIPPLAKALVRITHGKPF